MKPRHHRSFGFALLLAASAAGSPMNAVEIEARLVVPPGSEMELKSTLSLTVRALPAPLHQPVTKGTLLVEMDVQDLQKELEGQRKALTRAQAEKRELATRRRATSSTPASSSRADIANAQAVADAEMAESNAISDLARVQTELATADLRAPDDGYVLRNLYAVGAKAKKRKPLLVFVAAQKAVVEAAVPAAAAEPFTVGTAVRIADAGNPSRSFRGKILSADPAGDSVALRIQPLELPFLALEASASATLTATP